MTNSDLLASIDGFWEKEIIPTLSTYIEIPAKSPAFDPAWKKSGHIQNALTLVLDWVAKQNIAGLITEVVERDDRTPILLLDLKGQVDYQVLMYGHLDKQPEMTGWSEGLDPWKAVRRGDKLFGRGGADDGYAVFASICAIQHLLKTGAQRPHIKVVLEFSEESGSPDLPFYFDQFPEKFGTPNLIVCLDSGTGNYEQFWTTTSLRGLISGMLKVQVLREGVHSGDASGIVPSSFRVARMLLNRIENVESGEMLLKSLKVDVPPYRAKQIQKTAATLGQEVYSKFPFVEGMRPAGENPYEMSLNRTWRSTLSVVGAEGLPEPAKAGNVLRPSTSLKLSIRVPPTANIEAATTELKQTLEANPPYGAKVEFRIEDAAAAWDAPAMQPELESLIHEASMAFYSKEPLSLGEGGSIPFMGMLGRKFPKAQFVVTGVLGPNSNAHGPNEFIHLDYAKRLTACITHILAQPQRLVQR
jgi:acetylornithine deacetylase/succinyl-diaminopimelate desuccinylase-like protein